MIAFELFGWPVYWYGIFYLISFMAWYIVLSRVARTPKLQHLHNSHQPLFTLLREHLDDIYIVLILWVILWGRLWHVLFYDFAYYIRHIPEIIQINKWWMSFVGGILGVMIWLIYMKQKYKLSRRDFLLFWDFILLVVPLWSLLGRIGNFLNQELIGKPVSDVPVYISSLLESMNLTTIYTQWDTIVRVNINYIQSFFEWWILLILTRVIFCALYMKKWVRVGTISWWYLIGYGFVRFWMELLKDLPVQEMYGIVSVSQLLSIGLIIGGGVVLMKRKRY